jgi:signal transduction histidine kinase
LTREWDLSIGQRLVLGFGALLLLLGSVIVFAFVMLGRNDAVQREFTDEVLARRDRAIAVERALLGSAVSVRAYILAPTRERLERHESARRGVRAALHAIVALPKDPEAERLFVALESDVEEYLARQAELLEQASSGLSSDDEQRLAYDRERALDSIRAFTDLKQARADRVLATMAERRTRTRQALVVVLFVAVLAALALAWVVTESIRVPVRRVSAAAAALERGDWTRTLALVTSRPGAATGSKAHDEVATLERALGAAAVSLDQRTRRLAADGRVAAAAAASLDMAEIAREVLNAIVEHVGAEVGVVYRRNPDAGTLVPLVAHALPATLPSLVAGDGLPGQAVSARRTLVVSDIPHDTPFSVRLGYDASPPRTVAAVPVTFGPDILGAIVVATLRDMPPDEVAFLESAATQLGTGLQNALAHEHIERLLADLRETNRQIEEQSELLRTRNEELQAQSEEIQTQNEELQAHHEELQAQNEEIQAQSEELHVQGEELRDRNMVLERLAVDLEAHAARLAEADAQKNAFLGMLAHELRNPMAAMTVSLQILRASPPATDRAERARAVIDRQLQHMTRLIDDLLDVTRISRGKVTLNRERLDLVDVVRSCRDDQQATFDGRHVQLEIDAPAGPVWVHGDRTRLCQVVNNLLHNAAKFTPEGGDVRLRLSADHGAGEAIVVVTDSGIGIDPQLLPRLFEPFSQGPTTLARTGGGLGLGLALVKTLVELHGGRAEAHSDGAGRGAQFVVRLPLQAASHDVPAGAATPLSVRSWRMLLVEDNADAAWSLREALALDGHDVRVAGSGAEALAAAREFHPELVLCDIGLPAMDGYELARRFRADEALRSTRLVALTGYASESDRSQASLAGFDGHLAKPLRMDELARLLGAFETV